MSSLESTSNNNHIIFTKKDGHLRNVFGRLYHHAVIQMNSRYVKILKNAGIVLDTDVRNFSREEDGKIRENWEKFRKMYRIEEGILEIAGKEKIDKQVKNHKKLQENLWPCLCSGLPNRSAFTVQKRILYIFDPNFDEKEEYDLVELEKLLKFGEKPEKVAESLKIPLSFVQFFSRQKQDKKEHNFEPADYFRVLTCLADCVLDPNGRFVIESFDWRRFDQKWSELCSSVAPFGSWVMERFRKQFWHAERQFFNWLEPRLELKIRITMVHETMSRFYTNADKKKMLVKMPIIRNPTMFTVILEHFTKTDPTWQPPPILGTYTKKVKVEKVGKRVEEVKNAVRKRRSEAAKFRITSKRILEKRKRTKSVHFEEGDDEIEISSADVTSVEISTISGDLSIRPDETILAHGPMAPLAPKTPETFVPDQSMDLWSQITQ